MIRAKNAIVVAFVALSTLVSRGVSRRCVLDEKVQSIHATHAPSTLQSSAVHRVSVFKQKTYKMCFPIFWKQIILPLCTAVVAVHRGTLLAPFSLVLLVVATAALLLLLLLLWPWCGDLGAKLKGKTMSSDSDKLDQPPHPASPVAW